jgi:hypothetical protein
VLKAAAVGLVAAATFLLLDSMITGPANVDTYRRSPDDRHITVTLILSPIDAVIGQSITEQPDRVVVSVRIRRPPAVMTNVAVFREVTFDLSEPLGRRAVIDANGKVVRPQQ